MRSMTKRILILCMAVAMLLCAVPVGVCDASAAQATTEDALRATVEEQIRAFAKSINKTNADDSAASALAKHGLTGGGKKLSVGKTHALTATLMNAELSLATIIQGCVVGVEAMRKLHISSAFGDAGCYFGKSSMYYYQAALYHSGSAEGVGSDLIQISKVITHNGPTNAYDSSLVWMVGSTEIHIYISRGTVTSDTVVYNVKVVFVDDFDFNTNDGSVPREIASMLGSIFFKEFKWNATAEFSLTLPNDCTHLSPDYGDSCFTSKVTKPTCTARGYTTHTCSLCGYSYKDTYVSKIAHSMGAWSVTTPSSCTVAGEEQRKCKQCDYTESRDLALAAHSYAATVVPPTTTEEGYTVHTCTECQDNYKDSFADKLPVVWGDATGDGIVNGRDLVLLRQYLTKYDYETESSTVAVGAGCDANGDGVINGRDLVLLRQYLAGVDSETGESTVVLGPRA